MNRPLLIEKLNLDHFRGLNELIIDDLSAVNVFVGANNSGKTSVLEALKIMSEPSSLTQVVHLALHRAQVDPEEKKKNLIRYVLNIFQESHDEEGQSFYHIKLGASVRGIYYQFEVDGTVGEVVNSIGEDENVFDIAIKTSTNTGPNTGPKTDYTMVQLKNGQDTSFSSEKKSLYNTVYIHSSVSYYRSCATLLADYIVRHGKQDVLHIIQTFDPDVNDISIVREDIYLHSTHSGTMPLFAYGSGLQKAVLLAVVLAYSKNGAILIDEIDNAIHVSAFEDVFKWFFDSCLKWNVQAFLTTHSVEAIDAILKIAHYNHSEKDVLRIITLRKDLERGITRAKIRTGEQAYSDRSCYEMELRI